MTREVTVNETWIRSRKTAQHSTSLFGRLFTANTTKQEQHGINLQVKTECKTNIQCKSLILPTYVSPTDKTGT